MRGCERLRAINSDGEELLAIGIGSAKLLRRVSPSTYSITRKSSPLLFKLRRRRCCNVSAAQARSVASLGPQALPDNESFPTRVMALERDWAIELLVSSAR